jgi:hypothetical protein
VVGPAAMIERSAWIGFALCAPFSYLLYDGAPKWLVYALCYGLPAVAYAVSALRVRVISRWSATAGLSLS